MTRVSIRSRWAAALPILVFATAPLAAAPLAAQAPPGSEHVGSAFTFEEIRPGIWFAVGTGSLTVFSNATVIVNEEDVLVVDTHVSPAAAFALREELEAITDKPIRYVVSTHYHFDHAHGNQIYVGSAEIIGHEYTRWALENGLSLTGPTFARYLAPIPERVEQLRAQVAAAETPEAREVAEGRLLIQENFLEATNAVVPTPPTITLRDRMTLVRGGREIQIIHLGRGHTAGDVVVFLPEERLLMTGDLFYGGIPYMGTAYLSDWADTLERMKELDFEMVLPGHGGVVTDRQQIDRLQAYMRDLWAQIQEMHAAGVPAEEAAARIDLRAHGDNFAAARRLGADVDAVVRGYELLSEAR